MRPSARSVCSTVSSLLPPSREHRVRNEEDGKAAIFLDSFVLHPVNRITACHCTNLEGEWFEACVALSDEGIGGGSHNNTTLAAIAYSKESEKSELEIDVSNAFLGSYLLGGVVC